MDDIIPLDAGFWKLLLAPKLLRPQILNLLARLAERAPLLVLDGGHQFNAFRVARVVRGQPEVLKRIKISRAFTCYQMLSLLEGLHPDHETILLLDFLATFYDESVSFLDRSRLLKTCLPHVQRLSRDNGLLVTVHPPAMPSPQATRLIEVLANAAPGIFTSDTTPKPPEPLRLF